MLPSTLTTVKSLLAAMSRDGFRRGPPAGLAPMATDVDRRACLDMQCGQCQNRGLRYRTFHKGASYRVLAVCPRCGFAEEF